MKRRSDSPSSISTYINCPKKYEFKYFHRLPDPMGPEAEWGNEFHEAAYVSWQSRTLAGNVAPDIADALTEMYRHEGVKSLPHPEVVSWESIEQKFPDYSYSQKVSYCKMLLGQGKAISEFEVSTDCGDQTIFGYVDLVLPGGIVIDFKTSSKLFNQKKIDEALQHAAYPYALRKLGLSANQFIYIVNIRPTNKRRPACQTVILDISPEFLQDFENKFQKNVTLIGMDIFPPKRSDKCRYCPFQRYCPAWGNSLPPELHANNTQERTVGAHIPLDVA